MEKLKKRKRRKRLSRVPKKRGLKPGSRKAKKTVRWKRNWKKSIKSFWQSEKGLELKKKWSEERKGKKHSPESVEKIRASKLGKSRDAIQHLKMKEGKVRNRIKQMKKIKYDSNVNEITLQELVLKLKKIIEDKKYLYKLKKKNLPLILPPDLNDEIEMSQLHPMDQ